VRAWDVSRREKAKSPENGGGFRSGGGRCQNTRVLADVRFLGKRKSCVEEGWGGTVEIWGGGALYTPSSKANELEVSSAVA
jgi:hypothetical protein